MNPDEAFASIFLHTSLMKAVACGWTVDGPRWTKTCFPFGQRRSCEGPTGTERGDCSCQEDGVPPLFDAGHVSVAPELIYHSNCEWRLKATGEQRKAAQKPPSLTLHLVICAKAVAPMEKGDLVFWSSRWAKTLHTPLWLTNEIVREATRKHGSMVFKLKKLMGRCETFQIIYMHEMQQHPLMMEFT